MGLPQAIADDESGFGGLATCVVIVSVARLDVAFGVTLSYRGAIACVTICIRECKCATECQPGSSSLQ
ncbi:hypothetical protein NDI37_06445 [Funiculus sociatus GB2-A5]|uniref:Uncharacterized protein n=1 Tax=Funiculus sociatus GB2-A5 TaxID=2933946 RepID=A0ABV0JKY8_9CYAN|nr:MULTISPECIES: hypothetical protein [unclassified Trichocoleus]MBD1906293.1 hypothetical protein [Trichocoleus sp. FACHB-832]MBD2061458.1 hypothetical protein [Trichocoleus sp. FACHB-6]